MSGLLGHRGLLLSAGAAPAVELLLLRANGANGTTPIDDSSFGHVPAGVTGICQSAAARFGSAGLAFTSYNKHLDYAAVAGDEWEFGSNDFTIQMWCRARSNTGDQQCVFSCGVAPFAAADLGIECKWYTGAGGVGLSVYSGATSYISGAAAVPVGTWVHLAFVREGQTLRMYLDGVEGAHQTHPTMGAVNSFGGGMARIGTRVSSTGSQQLDADLDDYQVIKGVCLYRGGTTFAVPGAL